MKRLLSILYRLLLRVVPENRAGDRFIALMGFLWAHRRLPGDGLAFNDVLYRLKTSDEITDPLRVFVSDKEFLKVYVKAIIGEQFNVPTIAILRTLSDAKGYVFPSDCCIKPTHLSGQVILRRGSEAIDFDKISGWFRSSQYRATREANYRTLRPKVIVEPLVFDSDNVSDYKIFCYGGKRPGLIQVDLDRHTAHTRKYFDADWNEQGFSLIYPLSGRRVEKPRAPVKRGVQSCKNRPVLRWRTVLGGRNNKLSGKRVGQIYPEVCGNDCLSDDFRSARVTRLVSESATTPSAKGMAEEVVPSHDAPFPKGDRNGNPRGIGLLALLAEDYRTHGRSIFEPGFWAVAIHRFGNARMGVRVKLFRAGDVCQFRF